MPDEDDEPTQTTAKGAEIPVPDREDVLSALRKIAHVPDEGDDEPS